MPEQVTCKHCQREVTAGAWFCPFCAEPLASPTAVPAEVAAPEVTPSGAFEDLTSTMLDAMVRDRTAVEVFIEVSLQDQVPERWTLVERTLSGAPPAELTDDQALVLALLDQPQSIAQLDASGVVSRRALDVSLVALREQGLIELSTGSGPSTPRGWDAAGLLDRTLPGEALDLTDAHDGPKTVDPPTDGEAVDAEPSAPKPSIPAPHATVRKRLIPNLPGRAADDSLRRSDLGDGVARLSTLGKAEELARAAQRDRRTGSVVSARMNLLLAIALAPDEPRYARALEELSARAKAAGDASLATQRYEHARQLESTGHYSQAIATLRSAIELEERGAFYHRLGMLLAVHERELPLAERMLGRAIELEPENRQFVSSLAKVLSIGALRKDDDPRERRRAR